jgi:hypothetical protein
MKSNLVLELLEEGESLPKVLNPLCQSILVTRLYDYHVIVLDGFANSLIIPKNIVLLKLPPFCPELNPAERVARNQKQNSLKDNQQRRRNQNYSSTGLSKY